MLHLFYQPFAVKKLLSIHDKYAMQIYEPTTDTNISILINMLLFLRSI
jgi:hypothetical protein